MENLTLSEAEKLLLENVSFIEETEEVSLWDAHGRVLAEDIIARNNQPPFPRSPLDGYALRSEDIQGASKDEPVSLQVIDEVAAGHCTHKIVEAGQAVRIMTGAPIPKGADCILGQEDTDYGEVTVAVYESLRPYENYCFEGEDYKAGALLMKKGVLLRGPEIGILASLGRTKVQVTRKVCIAVLTTGDEIVLPGESLKEGQIYDSNLYAVATQLTSWGMEVTYRGRVEDDPEKATALLRDALEEADIAVTTGGVSVGKKDIMHSVLKLLPADGLFRKVRIKPGMPTLCAKYQGKLILCFSGNPYGAVVNTELLLRPVLARMAGRTDLSLERRNAVVLNGYPKKSRVTRYVRAHYHDGT